MSITIDISVPYANAADVHVTRDGDADVVHFTADPHGGPEAMWFCFRVHKRHAPGDANAKRLRLVLTNLVNLLGGGRGGEFIRPVVRRAGEHWQRLEPGRTERTPDGRMNGVWEIDTPTTYLDVALCYPYGPPELDQLLKDTGGYWKRDTIGVSQGGRPLVRLANDYGHEVDENNTNAQNSQRPGIYLLARQHSSETPGSWVLDGFLRQLAQLGDDAPLTWCVPLTNIDGVEQGDYGKDNFPYDLNRAWSSPPMRHEILVIQRDMRRWMIRCRPTLMFDFHAPGMCEDGGLYLFVPKPEDHPDAHAEALTWAEPMRDALGDTYANDEFPRVARYGSRWDTPNSSRYARETLSITGLTVEVPYAAAAKGETLLTIDAYRDAGARLATAVSERARQPAEQVQ